MIAAAPHIQRGEQAYRAHPFVSNSALSKLKSGYLNLEAFRFGTLFHSITLEFPTVNLLTGKIKGYDYAYTPAEIKLARAMRAAFLCDSLCRQMLASCAVEVEMYNPNTPFFHQGQHFALDTKRKYDLWSWEAGWGGDIKSTSATTEREFLRDIDAFDYDRGRVFYSLGSGASQDLIIGVSKVAPHRIFKVYMRLGDGLWDRGTDKANALAHEYWTLNTPF
ncbi:MAG TPA: hypothetical protein VGM89_15605 [Puia sp.]|jgi:hypothetical protein